MQRSLVTIEFTLANAVKSKTNIVVKKKTGQKLCTNHKSFCVQHEFRSRRDAETFCGLCANRILIDASHIHARLQGRTDSLPKCGQPLAFNACRRIAEQDGILQIIDMCWHLYECVGIWLAGWLAQRRTIVQTNRRSSNRSTLASDARKCHRSVL